jgi:hypothetical protein
MLSWHFAQSVIRLSSESLPEWLRKFCDVCEPCLKIETEKCRPGLELSSNSPAAILKAGQVGLGALFGHNQQSPPT